MIVVLLALTLAVAPAPPAATPAARPHPAAAQDVDTWSRGCPRTAIGFYEYTPQVKTAWLGALVEDRESYGGTGSAQVDGGMYGTTLHFWRAERGRPRLAAVAEVDPETHALRAIAGTVRKVGNVWCMFSMHEPIPAQFLRDPR